MPKIKWVRNKNPQKDGNYICSYYNKYDERENRIKVNELWWKNNNWYIHLKPYNESKLLESFVVIAWAEMPKPCKVEEEKYVLPDHINCRCSLPDQTIKVIEERIENLEEAIQNIYNVIY